MGEPVSVGGITVPLRRLALTVDDAGVEVTGVPAPPGPRLPRSWMLSGGKGFAAVARLGVLPAWPPAGVVDMVEDGTCAVCAAWAAADAVASPLETAEDVVRTVGGADEIVSGAVRTVGGAVTTVGGADVEVGGEVRTGAVGTAGGACGVGTVGRCAFRPAVAGTVWTAGKPAAVASVRKAG